MTQKQPPLRLTKAFQCCVRDCGSNSYADPHLDFHPIPREGTAHLYVTNESNIETKMDIKDLWEMILFLKKPALPTHMVCSRHFQNSDYKGKTLVADAIPTVDLPQRRTVKSVCMVELCQHSNSRHPYKRFFTLNRPASDIQARRWKMWRKAMWNNEADAVKSWVPLTVCAEHFVGGEPSSYPMSIDFIPSRNLPKYQIEEVNVNESFSVVWETTNLDPLELPEPEFVAVEGGMEEEEEELENVIKIEIDEVHLEDSEHEDHCYC